MAPSKTVPYDRAEDPNAEHDPNANLRRMPFAKRIPDNIRNRKFTCLQFIRDSH
jgi:hypothetical protein